MMQLDRLTLGLICQDFLLILIWIIAEVLIGKKCLQIER